MCGAGNWIGAKNCILALSGLSLKFDLLVLILIISCHKPSKEGESVAVNFSHKSMR